MFSLQRVVFDEADERLVAALATSRPGKKEKKTKTNFLCLTVKTNTSFLHRVRVTTDESYTKKKTWPLQALTAIDNVKPDSCQFILTFDKSLEWIAPNVTEKQRFLEAIVKSCRRYNKTLPQLSNFKSIPGGGVTVSVNDHRPSATSEGDGEQSDDDLYQEPTTAALSKQQQEETVSALEKYDWAQTDVKALSDSLQAELQALESANVHAMISSELQVTRLLGRVDDTLSRLDRLEQCITDYDGIVKPLRRDAQRVAEQARMIHVQQNNFVSLRTYLTQLTDFLHLSKEHISALSHPDFNTSVGLGVAIAASSRLYSLLHTQCKPGWQLMAVVGPHRKQLVTLQSSFADQLVRHVALQIESATQPREAQDKASTAKHDHHQRRALLKPLAPLMHWLRQIEEAEDFSRYETLAKTYSAGLSPVYAREVQGVVASFKAALSAGAKDKSQSPRTIFRKQFNSAMDVIVPLVLEEQRLCEEFFGLGSHSSDNDNGDDDNEDHNRTSSGCGGDGGRSTDKVERKGPSTTGGSGGSGNTHEEEEGGQEHDDGQSTAMTSRLAAEGTQQSSGGQKLKSHARRPSKTGSVASVNSQLTSPDTPQRAQSRGSVVSQQMNSLLNDLLSVMFNGLDDAVLDMMRAGNRLDAFNSTATLVTLSRLSSEVEDKSTFLFHLLGKCYVFAKRLYDAYILSVVDSITNTPIKRKDGSGILPFVASFSDLVKQTEAIGAKQDCHPLFDKAYVRIVKAVFDRIHAVSEGAKEPDVVLFENFHNLYDQLSRLKLEPLKQHRAEAQERYRTHLNRFVRGVLGRPMERLSNFFEGVEQLIRQGTAPQDVSYYSEFSKQQLRATIKLYPGKEVKKGLESTYKRVQKQLSPEENLLVVVWRSIQEEFVRLHSHFEALIARCYPNSNIRLEFEVQDLLQYFASIAERA